MRVALYQKNGYGATLTSGSGLRGRGAARLVLEGGV